MKRSHTSHTHPSKRQPQESILYRMMMASGKEHLKNGRIKEAFNDFVQAYPQSSEFAISLHNGFNTNHLLYLSTEALDILITALKSPINDYFALATRGEVYRMQGKYKQALTDFNKVLQICPNQTLALNGRGTIYFTKELIHAALIEFTKVIQLNPCNAFALIKRGEIHQKLGLIIEAQIDFITANDPFLTNALTLICRSGLYQRLGRYPEALADLSNVLSKDEKNILALNNRGEIYRLMGDIEKALDDFNSVIQELPNNSFALGRRGAIHLLKGDFPNALHDLNIAIYLDELNYFALNNRARLHAIMNQEVKALVDSLCEHNALMIHRQIPTLNSLCRKIIVSRAEHPSIGPRILFKSMSNPDEVLKSNYITPESINQGRILMNLPQISINTFNYDSI